MAGPSVIRSSSVLRNFQIFALDANGYPAAPDTTAYEGVQVIAAKTVGLTDPEPRRIPYTGDGQVFDVDVAPPLEANRGQGFDRAV